VGRGDLEEAGVGEAGGAGGDEDGVAIGNDRRDVDIGAAEVVVLQRLGQVLCLKERVGTLRGRGAADQERVLAVRDFVRLHGEDGVAGDVLGPDVLVDCAGFEVFGEQRLGRWLGLQGGGRGCGGRRGEDDQGEEESFDQGLRHGGKDTPGWLAGASILR
jgi:hypothetical protein